MPTNALIDPLGIEQSDPLNIESGQGYRFPTTPSFTVPVESGRRNIVPAATEPDATQYPKLFIPPPTASEISLVGEKLKEAAPPELTEAEAAKQFRESVPLDEGSLGRPIPKTFRLKTPTTENMRNQALTELGQNYLKLADTAQTFGGGLEKAFSGEGGGLKALPFIGAIASVPQQKLRNELLEKVKSGTPLNDTEKSTVDALLLAQRRIYQPEKFWEKVGELTGGSAPYALEFALSAGAYSWAKTAAGRWLLSVPGDALAAGLARGAGVAAQTAAGGIPRVASEYLDRMAPKWSANPKDFKSIIFDEEADKNWLDQLTKSFGSQFIENLSERLSGPIGRGGDVLMDKLGAKRLLARSVRLGAIQDALNKGAAKNFMDAANKMKSAAGFTGGITGEVLEEYAGNGLKSLSGVDTQNSVPQELWKGDFVGAAKAFLNSLPVKDTPAMAVSFGIIPAGQHAVGLGLAGAGKMAEKLDERRQEKAFDLLSADVANRNALEGTMPAPAQGRTGVRPFSDVEQLPASAVIPEDTKFPTRVATGLQTPTVGETQNIPIDDPRRLVVLPKRKAIRRANSRRITLGEQAAPALATSPDSADIDRVAQWIANQDPNAAIPPERMVAEISKQYQYTKDAAQAVYNGAVQQLGIGGQNASGQPSAAQVGVLGQGREVGPQTPLRQSGQTAQAVPQAEAPSQPQVSRNWLINITPPTTNAKGKALPGAVQIDMMRGDVNERGSNPDELRSEGYDIPNKEEFFKLPKGRYTLGQALDLLAQQANQAQKGVTPNGQEEEGRQALLTKLSPDAFLHPSGAPNGARAKVRWAVVSASQASPMVNRTINEFQPSQREGDVEAKELRFKIGSNPDTSILFESTSADRGAPTIDAQAMRAVAGNTRLWGLIDGYKAKTKGIRRYRGEVLKKAAQISPQLLKQAESIEDPILVLMADAYEGGNRSQFVVEANQSALQREDSVTQSVQDARALGDLTRYSFTAQGLLTSQSAQVAAEKLQAAQRQKEIRTRSGTVDLKKLSARVQRAAMSQMAQQAGMDAADLIYLFESEHGQRVVGEVVRAAPLLAKLEGDLNLGVDLIAALRELQIGLESVRDESSASLDEWQKNRANELAGVRNQLSQEAELLLAQMVIAQRKPKVLREVLETYANTAAVEQKRRADAEGGDLTGEVRKPITGGELVRRAIPAENQAGTAPSGGGKSQPSELKETAALIPGESMGAELDRLLKLRDTLGKGTKEIAREAKRFLAWLAENRPDITRFDDIKNSDLIEYAATGVQSGRTIDANSRNKYLRFVAQVLEWLSPDHPTLLQLSKSMAFEPAKAPPRVEGSQGGFFKPEATAKLVAPETSSNAYRIRDKAFFALMRYTGFRVEDVLRLKLNQIDLERGIIKDALISKRNVILPMRAIPELAIFNIRRYLESGARGMLGDAKSEYLFPGTGKKGFTTVGNMLLRIQKMAKEEGVTLANDADAQTKAFRATFAQDLVVGARLDKQTVNELSGRVGEDVTESNYLSRHSDSDWIENVNRPAVSALPENRAFVASQQSNSNPALPKADASTLQWRQRKAGERDLSAGLSGKRLARYNQLRDRTNLTPAEQAELEALSNVNQQPLFGEDIESEIQSSAAAKAAELRRQADENDRLGNLRLDAWALGEKKARGEADAYFNEAERLRKLARDMEPKTRKSSVGQTPDLFSSQPELHDSSGRSVWITPPTADDRLLSIRAYHGSPHLVDRFSTSKIGTGEGAQVYGWGLYFAQNREVGRQYAKTVTEKDFMRKVRELYDEFHTPSEALEQINNPENGFTEGQKGLLEALSKEDWLGFDYPHQALQAAVREPQNVLVDAPLTRAALEKFGYEYTVEINATPQELLDWDRPLSAQPQTVIQNLKRMALANPQDFADIRNRVMDETISGGDLYYAFGFGDAKTASEVLSRIGIKGIRYLDQGSRGQTDVFEQNGKWFVAGDRSSTTAREFETRAQAEEYADALPNRTYNYVIFDENNIKIVSRNGETMRYPEFRNLSIGKNDQSTPRRKRIGFNPSENGFTVTYSRNPFGGTVREIRSDNLNDMLFLVSHPSLTMDETLRSALKGIVSSGVLDRLPLLHLAITDFIEGSIPGQKMYRGEYIQSQQLARLWNLAGSVDAAHEVLHHIHRFLSSADRDWIRVMRIRAIAAELKKSRNYAELGQLEKLLKEQYSSDGFSAEDFAPELYHLANEYEFFAWMMQDRAAQYFTRAADVRFIDRIRSILRDLFYSLRKMLNLTSRDEEIWQQIIKGDYQYDLTSAKEWANDTQRNLSVPTEEVAYTMGDRLDPETAWAQIESASRLAIPATVKAKLDEYNGAITELESREYDTQRYKQARKTIQRLVDEALIREEQSGAAYWQSEENLPSFSDENLGDKLEALGINFDKDALAEMQKEIRFERRARTLASWRRQLEGVNQTIATFQSLGWNPEDYDEFTKTAARLTKSISRYEFNPDRDNAQMMTVSERAIEIETARANEPALKAKRDALNIPMVNQIFVEPNEAGYIPSTRLTRTLQGFEAAMNSGDLNENYKDAIAKETWDRVVEYETAYNLFNQWKGLEVARVSKQLRTAKAKLADAKMDFGLALILADESARVGNGERGLTGSLSSREAVNFLNDSFGALVAFARSLRTQYPNGGAEPVLMRILAGLSTANPGTFTPESSYFGTVSRIEAELAQTSDPDLQEIRRNAGVADYALARILYVLARSDSLESAVGAILRYGERRTSGIRANQLDRIAALLDSGDEFAIIEGRDRLWRLADEARNSQALLSREMKSIEREIYDAEVALMAIDRGEELFQAVQDSPQFHEIRKKVVEWLNLRQEMIADTGGSSGDQRGVSLIFKKFSLDAAGVKINRDEDLVINAADEVYDKKSDFLRIQDWYNDAKRYVIAFREADTRNRLDPENNRTPEALGFDRTIYNGLEDALKREGRFQDTGILFLEGSLQHNVFQQWLTGMSFFRQFLVGLKMANGQAAKSALSSAVSYGNALNISKTVYHRHKFTVQRARLAALKSHPEFKNDLELYRDQVFNEMAAEGRQFGETLKAGMTLPVTGHVVTKEDISYLVAVKNMSNDYMRNVSERFAGGILEERGHEKSGTRRVFRRRAASVGEYGLPMQLKESAKEVLRKLTEAYAKRDERPTAKDDLTRESQNKAVRFWNRNIKYLTRHILDSGRQFRTIEQEPEIMRAEQRAAAELRELNNPKAIQSVDDAVALIAKYLPRDSGRDVREWAASGLLAELEQYFSRAEAALPKAADVEKSQGIGGITARSEFSTAAAQFNFPSNLYEYGAVTNRDMLMQSSRVMHEPIMELNRSMERVQAAISSEIDAMQESASLATNYSNVKEALRVRKIIQGLIGDLAKSWNFKDSDVARHGLEMPPDIIKSALLAGLTVNIRNIITGGLLQFNNIAMLDRHSRMFALLKALRNVSAISARVPLELMFGQDWPVGRYGKKWIIEPMRKLGHPLTQMLLDRVIESELPSFIKQGAMTASRLTPWAIVDAHNDYVAKVQQLGFSLRDPQWEALKRMVGDTNVHQTTLGGQLDSGKMSTVRRAAGNVSGAGSLFFRGIGAEYFDKIINAQSLAGAAAMERLLCELSEVYGESRKGFGEYNPADARWRIAPEDYSKRLSKWGQQQNLAAFLDFMAGADLQVESLLWNYYTQMQAFRDGKRTEPSMLTDDQFDALRAAFIRAMNAGDALNRPASLRNSRLWRVLATFQGYVSSYLLSLIGLGNGVRGSSAWSKYVLGTQMAVAYAFSSTAIILISNAATDWWKRHMQGAAQRQVTILTREFWTDANKALDASTDAAIGSVPYVGDFGLFIRGTIVNNRGYEPTGRVLAFSLLNDAFATARGVFNLVRNDPENALNPIRDMILKYVGLGKEVAYATSPHYQAVKDFNAGQGVLRYQNEQAGFLQDKEAGNVKPGQYYSPTSGIREDLKADMVAQDPNRLARDFKKLVDYYTSKGLKNPQSVAVNDFKQMHPAVQAMGGKKPTTEQYDSVYKGLSDAQRASVNKSVAAWNWGANTLGINYSPFASVSLGQVSGGSVPRVPAARRISIGGVGRAVSGLRSKLRGVSTRLKLPRKSTARRISLGKRFAFRRPSIRRPRLSLA